LVSSVLPLMVSVPTPALSTPPPCEAELPGRVLLLSVRLPSLYRPPPPLVAVFRTGCCR
jgi:hypothetical protein